jgi:hypothetical protein
MPRSRSLFSGITISKTARICVSFSWFG